MRGTDQLEKIGQVLKSHGADGRTIIRLYDAEDAADIEKEPVYIYFDGLPVPFFITGPAPAGGGKYAVRLTGCHTLEDALEMVGRTLYAPVSEGEDSQDIDFVGWTLATEDGPVARVTAFEDIPGNPCLEVETERGTVLVPLNNDFIVKSDPEARVLTMSLPDGLL